MTASKVGPRFAGGRLAYQEISNCRVARVSMPCHDERMETKGIHQLAAGDTIDAGHYEGSTWVPRVVTVVKVTGSWATTYTLYAKGAGVRPSKPFLSAHPACGTGRNSDAYFQLV